MRMLFTHKTQAAAQRSRELAFMVLAMYADEDPDIERSDDEEEIIRMIQLNGMIGTDPELADVV